MKCRNEGCTGKVDMRKSVSLMIGCGGLCGGSYSHAYPCDTCGRLHWKDGSPVFNRAGQKAFLINNIVILKD